MEEANADWERWYVELVAERAAEHKTKNRYLAQEQAS
jgi:hypothetical protein